MALLTEDPDFAPLRTTDLESSQPHGNRRRVRARTSSSSATKTVTNDHTESAEHHSVRRRLKSAVAEQRKANRSAPPSAPPSARQPSPRASPRYASPRLPSPRQPSPRDEPLLNDPIAAASHLLALLPPGSDDYVTLAAATARLRDLRARPAPTSAPTPPPESAAPSPQETLLLQLQQQLREVGEVNCVLHEDGERLAARAEGLEARLRIAASNPATNRHTLCGISIAELKREIRELEQRVDAAWQSSAAGPLGARLKTTAASAEAECEELATELRSVKELYASCAERRAGLEATLEQLSTARLAVLSRAEHVPAAPAFSLSDHATPRPPTTAPRTPRPPTPTPAPPAPHENPSRRARLAHQLVNNLGDDCGLMAQTAAVADENSPSRM